jgi:hypothetical protein
MGSVLPAFIKHESFRFSPLKCRDLGISLQAAKFLRWLYLEPQRTNGQISATFGLTLAFSMLDAGYVFNPLNESAVVNSNLWSLTDKGVEALMQLAGVK